MIVAKPDTSVKKFKHVLTKLVESKWKTSTEADDILSNYKKFVSEANQYHHDKFSGFVVCEQRLDTFFFDALHMEKSYANLWNTLKLLLTMSHGQAALERGFSVNKEVLAPNLKEVSLTAIRLIHDLMLAQQTKVADFVITEDLLKSCSHASKKCKMHLMDQSKQAQEIEKK